MKNESVYYSQFLREFSLHSLYVDLLIVILSVVAILIAPFFLENPMKTIRNLFITRAVMVGSHGLEEYQKLNGFEVLTSDDLLKH